MAASKQSADAEQMVQQLRELFADAPELGKKALENALREIKTQVSETPPPAIESAGGIGEPGMAATAPASGNRIQLATCFNILNGDDRDTVGRAVVTPPRSSRPR